MIVAPRSRNDPCPCGSGQRYKHCHGTTSAGVATVAYDPQPMAGIAPADRAILDARAQFGLGKTAAVESVCRAVLAELPDHSEALILLAELKLAPDPAEAEILLRRAIDKDPANPEPRFHLGNLLRNRDENTFAIEQYERALAAMPRHVGLLNNLGLALESIDDLARAERCYRDALAVEPRHPDALGNLASVLYDRHDRRTSAALYRQLLAIRRDLPAAVLNRHAMVEEEVGSLEIAEAGFRAAFDAAPTDRHIRINLASLLVLRQKYAEAEPLIEAALELEPEQATALTLSMKVRQNLCKWDGLDAMMARLVERVTDESPSSSGEIDPFVLLSLPVPREVHLRASRRWAARFAPQLSSQPPHVRLAPGERPRVAFISSDFRQHPMVQVISECFERINRDRIEAIAYGIAPEDHGPGGQRIKGAIESFVDVSQYDDEALVERLRADRIAIAVDLNGFTKGSRPAIFAQRVAPIQLNAIGYPASLGAPWYDYIQVDRFGAPPEDAAHYTERFLYLPNCAYPSDTTRAPTRPPPPRASLGLPENGFVFCCLNNSLKIHPGIFSIWLRLLDAVPGSVLWLLQNGEDTARNLRNEFARGGVAPDRLVFAARVSPHEHLARIPAADLFVDTFPYGGHTTTNETLLTGVPVVTCVGETLPSRIAGSQLHAIGASELVTDTFADYEALALRLARNPAELAQFRARIVANRRTHPLFDMARYTRDFEDALLQAWDEYVAAMARR